jgi:hypothetical protein
VSRSLSDLLAGELHQLVAPLADAIEEPALLDPLLDRLGMTADAAGGSAALVASLQSVVALEQEVASLAASPNISFTTIGNLLDQAQKVMTAVRAIGQPSTALADLAEDVVQLVLGLHLAVHHPLMLRVGALLGIIDQKTSQGTTTRAPCSIPRIHLSKLIDLVRDPVAALRVAWVNDLATVDAANQAADALFPTIGQVLTALGVGWRYGFSAADRAALGDTAAYVDHSLIVFAAKQATADAGFMISLTSADRGGPGLVITPFGTIDVSVERQGWKITLGLDAQVGSFAVASGGVHLLPGTEHVNGSFSAGLKSPAQGPAFVFGSPAGTRVEVGGAELTAELAVSTSSRALDLSAGVSNAAIVVAAGDGDGFLRRILPQDGLRTTFDLGVAWSNASGLRFHGGAGLEATLPVSVTLGPLSVPTLHLALHADGGGLAGEVSVSVSLSLGPLRALVDGVGMTTTLGAPAGAGNLGVADFGVGFKLPNGIGFSVDAGGISGGGFLSHEGHRYAGAADLGLLGIALKGYGLVETELPGGVQGYSFLLILSAEFSPGVRLPFGFTLDGVGGLIGIHRTLAVQAVQAALWSHHFDGLLFPKDPVAAAPTILASIDSYFPAAEGRYVFGPLAKIGWGEGIVEALIGLVLEVPEPIRLLLLGEVSVQVPQKLTQLELHIDFDGGVDFGQKLAFFDATLHDSRVEAFPITGDLAFRWSWGDPSVFALAIGGFHPQFQPPAGFPPLNRVAITIGADVAQLVAKAYFALTSNTLQFGAHVELTAGTGSFNVHGWLGLDALCEWSPFSFAFDLSAGVELRHHSSVLASVHLDGHLSGPTPWHVSGDASISLFFFDVSVHFDVSWGNQTPSLPPADPTPALHAALADGSAWTSPATTRATVTLQARPSDAGDAVLLDPSGALRIAQRVVPLDRTITRFGGAPLAEPRTFSLAYQVFGQSAGDSLDEEFALAQFEDLSDDEKLSLPSFTRLAAGVEVGGARVDLGSSARARAVVTPLSYDQSIIDSLGVIRPIAAYTPSAATVKAMNTSARPGAGGLARYLTAAPPLVTLAADDYLVAGVGDLHSIGLGSDGSKLGALRALADYLDQHPAARGQLQVVLHHEAA